MKRLFVLRTKKDVRESDTQDQSSMYLEFIFKGLIRFRGQALYMSMRGYTTPAYFDGEQRLLPLFNDLAIIPSLDYVLLLKDHGWFTFNGRTDWENAQKEIIETLIKHGFLAERSIVLDYFEAVIPFLNERQNAGIEGFPSDKELDKYLKSLQ